MFKLSLLEYILIWWIIVDMLQSYHECGNPFAAFINIGMNFVLYLIVKFFYELYLYLNVEDEIQRDQ